MSTRPSPPLQPLIIGLGHSGLQVHLPTLTRLRNEGGQAAALLGHQPTIGYDAKGVDVDIPADELQIADSMARVTELVYPGNTVVHVCTPPSVRSVVLRELAERGFRLMLVDYPIADDAESLRQVLSLAGQYRLRVGVVAPWLSSGITQRLLAAVGDQRFGSVRRITVRHRIPRLTRTFASETRSTVLDVELPHSIALALAVAGNGEVASASMENTPVVDDRWVADMGGATVKLRHNGGAHTEIVADLAAPVWEQRVLVEFEQGAVECYFPLGAGDEHAHMYWMPERGRPEREIFPDDALGNGFYDTYRTFVGESWPEPSLRLHGRVVELIASAKNLCHGSEVPGQAAGPELPPAPERSGVNLRREQPEPEPESESLPRRPVPERPGPLSGSMPAIRIAEVPVTASAPRHAAPSNQGPAIPRQAPPMPGPPNLPKQAPPMPGNQPTPNGRSRYVPPAAAAAPPPSVQLPLVPQPAPPTPAMPTAQPPAPSVPASVPALPAPRPWIPQQGDQASWMPQRRVTYPMNNGTGANGTPQDSYNGVVHHGVVE